VKLEVYEGVDGEWYWRRIAGNGEIVAEGEGYTRKADATEGAKLNFPDDTIKEESEKDVC